LDTSLYVNLSYASSLDRRLELVANNIANLNTVGFKAERAMFDDASFKAGPAADVSFVIDRASYTDYRTGSINQTGNELDVAVIGDGWLSVETENGVRYTRDGRMTINQNSELSALDGSPVLDRQGGRIIIPQEALNVAINRSGEVSVQIQGEPLPQQLGEIGIFEFGDEQTLQREADGRFNAANIAPEASQNGRVQQFAIEGSNINPIKEIVELMELSRAYSQTASSSQDIHDQKKDSIKRLGSNQ
jgi:flagellar basal-body rod protein FlgF